MKKTYVAAGAAVIMIALVAAVAVLAFDGDKGDEGRESRVPTATAGPPIVDRGTATPPAAVSPTAGPDTPVSDRDTPVLPSPTRSPSPGTMRVLAPIESVDVVVLETFPPRYRLMVKAGLPNGCVKPDGYDITRSGNDIRVAVYNTIPSTPVACTQIYGIYDLNIDLGSDFIAGQDYRVEVNGKVITFRAQ